MENKPPVALIAGAVAAVAIASAFAYRRHQAETLKTRKTECRALASALDKTVRARSPRIFEGIVENRWDEAAGRCLAALEYHYKPCDAAQREKTPLFCEGPDADIAIYAFVAGGARPLMMCERHYESGEAGCSEPVYGEDGVLISSRDIPPDQFPALKASLFPAPAKP